MFVLVESENIYFCIYFVRKREAEAEVDAKDAAEANAKNEETDSDDDVQFISSSFDPDVAAKHKTIIEQNSNLIQTLSSVTPGNGPRYRIYYYKK